MNDETIKEMCEWLKLTKCITQLTVEELANYLPEFLRYKSESGSFNKVEHIDIGI